MTTDGSDLVPDITPLTLSDNFYDWFTATNQLINAVNPLNIYDITARKGLSESRAGGNVILDVDTGKGLKAYPNDATGSVTLDFESLTSAASVANDDLFVIETPTTGNSNDLFKISATNMLPPTIAGNHEFTGTITTAALNVRDNALRLQYGDATTETDSGIILDTTSSSKVKFTYNTAAAAWFSNRGIGISSGYNFVTDDAQRRAEFKFATNGGQQYDVGLELIMGLQSTDGDDKSWIIEARNVDRALNFIYKSYDTTDIETRIFYATVDSPDASSSTFVITDKIQIGDVANSTTNFAATNSTYSANIIPISNSNGILNPTWTNRFVTTSYSSVSVGNLVKIYDDTNNQATIVKCSLTSVSDESEAYSLGIVERESGGKVWVVTHGEFTVSGAGFNPGSVYYLTSGTPNYTLTKPTTGIVKPVFVATSSTTGIIFPMNAQGLSFGRFNASADGGTLIGGSTVSSGAPNDIFTLVAGSGISLQTTPGSKSVTVRALTAGNQPAYSTIVTNSGTAEAYGPDETLILTGTGGISVSATDIASTEGDSITITGSYFRTVSWSGDSTNDVAGSVTATVDDTLDIYAGTGISIQSYAGGFRIDATGASTPSINDNSISLSKLIHQTANSVLVANGLTSPQPVTALTASSSVPTILTSNGSLVSFQNAASVTATYFTSIAASSGAYGITPTRQFGIIPLSKTAVDLTGKTSTSAAAFRYITSPGINGGVVGLQEGDGITLTLLNTTSNAPGGLPTIKITCDYAPSFSGIYITDTGETIVAADGDTLTFSTTSSPISIDSNTNTDTINFGIATNSITNNYLATMADNTVKVGTGSTNADNSPQDLPIGANSVLGRVGSGDLKSISATELNTILSGKYFTSVNTDLGTLTPSDTTTLTIVGGSGITVSVSTDNEIVITSSGGGGGNGITEIYDWNGTTSTSSSNLTGLEKLYFQKGDLAFDLNSNGAVGGIVIPRLNWDDLSVAADGSTLENGGPGLLYGFGAASIDGSSIQTQFRPIGNGETSGYRLPVINANNGRLLYIKRETTQTDTIDRVLGFKSDGTLVSTDKFVNDILFTNITGLTFTVASGAGTLSANSTVPVSFPQIRATSGAYFGGSSSLGLMMIDNGTEGSSDFILATSDSLPSSWSGSSYLTSLKLAAHSLTSSGFTSLSNVEIRTRYFGSSVWANLSTATICMPTRFLVGVGPLASTATEGQGVLLRSDTTNNSLTFTNYNLSASTKTVQKDRSCRLGLEVLDVDTAASNAYANTKNTAYISHTYLPLSASSVKVDEFTTPSSNRSYKYLVHAETAGGEFYTAELLIQVKPATSTVNIMQYASSTTSSTLAVTYSAKISGGNVLVEYGTASAGTLNIKLIKYEV